jgi:hypothetical protein
MKFFPATVGIEEIDANDHAFKITSGRRPDDLIHSIADVGLISPPILRQTGNTMTVVCGFRRIEACRSLGWNHLDARIIKGFDATGLDCLMLAIADNCFNRQLNVIEQAEAVVRLSQFVTDDTALVGHAQKAGLSLNRGLIGKLRKLALCSDDLKKNIKTGIIPLSIGLALNEMNASAATELIRIFEVLKPTLNHQKEIIRLLEETARASDTSVENVMTNTGIFKTMANPDLDRMHKISTIRLLLKKARYPEIVRFENAFLSRMKNLELPADIRLLPPADFEGNQFSMQLTFETPEQFSRITDLLNQLQNYPDFIEIVTKNFEDQ